MVALVFGGGGTQDARTKERNSLEESFNAETQSAQSNSLW